MKIIAIDAGGTKARFALYDEHGNVLRSIEHPSLHPLQIGYSKMAQALRYGVDTLLENETADFISFGLAGYGMNPKIRKSIEKAIKRHFYNEAYSIQSDVDCALMAALKGSDGIMVIAGTGSIALSQFQGQRHRVGGWGYWIGDEGSAFWIGKQVLGVFSKMADGRLKKTELYDCVMDSLVLQEESDLVKILSEHKRPKEAIASLARVCFMASTKGDKHAIKIFKDAADELAQLIEVSLKTHPDLTTIRLSGGVFESGEVILNPLREALPKHLDIQPITNPPLYGAYLIGKMKGEELK
jgi:N-acetylglucosamine kinase-like BadF-type ATPase